MKHYSKVLILTVLAVCTLLFSIGIANAAYENLVQLRVDGELIDAEEGDLVLITSSGRVMISLSLVEYILGNDTSWDAGSMVATVEAPQNTIIMGLNSPYMMVDDNKVDVDINAQIINGRIMLPLRAICEVMGLQLSWDGETRTVDIYSRRDDPDVEAEQESDAKSEPIKIAVTTPSFDDVERILSFFGDDIEIHRLSRRILNNIEYLQEFQAIFINCGSHNEVNPVTLNAFVSQGGIVYASDHAGRVLQVAFPEMIELFTGNSAQVISDAEIVHSTLASHMRISYLDIIFDMGGWYSITELSDYATVYIEGKSPRSEELIPIAISFDYGDGRVFYTSFHNNAQATFHIINFIEYLVFRILNVEADRTLQEAAERDGFVYRGVVFGGGAGRAAEAMAPPLPAPDSDIPFAQVAPSPPHIDIREEYFRYTFIGQGFMLMFGADSEFYTVTLIDPNENRFVIDSDGVVSAEISSGNDAAVPVITLEFSDGYRVLVTNITPGQWQFTAVPRNSEDIMIGIAVME